MPIVKDINLTTKIDLRTFQQITDTGGQFKAWQEIVYERFLEPKFYNEFLGSTIEAYLISPETDNVEFENTSLPTIRKFDSTSATSFQDTYNNASTLNKDQNILQLKQEFEQSLKYNLNDKRTALDWERLLSSTMANFVKVKNDWKNKMITQAIVDICLVTGQFWYLPELGTDYAFDETGSKDFIYREANFRLNRINNAISTERSSFNMGCPETDIRVMLDVDTYDRYLRGITYGNNGDQVLKTIGSGTFSMFLGYPVAKTAYLNKDFIASSDPTDKTGDYKFSNIIGVITSTENICYAERRYDIERRYHPDQLYKWLEVFGWICDVGVFRNRTTFNAILVKTKPQLTDCQEALERLKKQASWYGAVLPASIDQGKIDTWFTAHDLHFYTPKAADKKLEKIKE